jgi:hypothetical protein
LIIPKIRVNDTCGLHIHLSFDKLENYYALADWKFVNAFQKEYTKRYIRVYQMSRKFNRYCRFYKDKNDCEKTISEQMERNEREDRYRCVNFKPYKRQQTVEFRIFAGARNYEEFEEYLTWLTNFVATYINKKNVNKFKEIKMVANEGNTKKIRTIVLKGYKDVDESKSEKCENCGYNLEDCDCDSEPDEDDDCEYEEDN